MTWSPAVLMEHLAKHTTSPTSLLACLKKQIDTNSVASFNCVVENGEKNRCNPAKNMAFGDYMPGRKANYIVWFISFYYWFNHPESKRHCCLLFVIDYSFNHVKFKNCAISHLEPIWRLVQTYESTWTYQILGKNHPWTIYFRYVPGCSPIICWSLEGTGNAEVMRFGWSSLNALEQGLAGAPWVWPSNCWRFENPWNMCENPHKSSEIHYQGRLIAGKINYVGYADVFFDDFSRKSTMWGIYREYALFLRGSLSKSKVRKPFITHWKR